jgi:hypothetical protein
MWKCLECLLRRVSRAPAIPPVLVSEIRTEGEPPNVVHIYRLGGELDEAGERENSVGVSSSSNYDVNDAVMLI